MLIKKISVHVNGTAGQKKSYAKHPVSASLFLGTKSPNLGKREFCQKIGRRHFFPLVVSYLHAKQAGTSMDPRGIKMTKLRKMDSDLN